MWSTPKFLSLKDPALRVAMYDTGDVHSDVQASKPVLFLVHGLAINAMSWTHAVEHLRYNYRCIAIDLPGHGNSHDQRGNFSMSFYAHVVRSCIEALKLTDITLIGHSMGGQISVITALQLPAVVQRLVLVSAAGIETFTNEEGQQIVQGTEYFYRAPVDIAHVLALYQPHFSMHAERVRELAEEHITQQAERFSAFTETVIASVKGMLKEPVSGFLPHIHQPTLVLYGENDRLIPNKWVHPAMTTAQVAEEARQRIHNANVQLVPGGGHYLPFEQPKEFAERVHLFCLSTENS